MLCSPRSQMEVSSHSNGTGQARWAAKSQKHITPDLKSNHRTALMSVSLEYCFLPRARSTEVNFGLQNCLSSSAVLTLPTRFIWTCKSPPIQSSIWTVAIKKFFSAVNFGFWTIWSTVRWCLKTIFLFGWGGRIVLPKADILTFWTGMRFKWHQRLVQQPTNYPSNENTAEFSF